MYRYIVCVICVVNIKHSNMSSQKRLSIATLEIRLRSIRIKGAIISNYLKKTLCTNALNKFILHNDVNTCIQHSFYYLSTPPRCFVCSFYNGIYYNREYNII